MWDVHRWNGFLLHSTCTRVPNDTHDLSRSFIRNEIQCDALSQSFFVWKETARECLIDDDDESSRRRILAGEIAPPVYWNSHGTEEIRRNGKVARRLSTVGGTVCGTSRRRRRSRPAFNQKRHHNAGG